MTDDELSGTIATAFRRANPVPLEKVAGRRSTPSAHALFAEIVSQPPRRVRPRRIVAFAVVAALVAVSIAAFAVIRRDDATPATSALCFAEQSVDSKSVVAGFGDPAAACEQVWRDGAFGDAPVPLHFDECVLSTGAPAVFPGDSGSVCSKLGLSPLKISDLETRVQDFMAEAGPLVGAHCIGDAEAQVIVQRELKKFELSDWTIADDPSAPYTDESPCASIAPVPERRQILLVPVGRR